MNFNGTNSEVQADVVSLTKKKVSKGAVAAAAAAVIVGGAGVSYAAVPAVRNTVKMSVMKPDKYVASVYEDLEDGIDSAVKSSALSESNFTDITYDLCFDDEIMGDLRSSLGPDIFSTLVVNMTMVSGDEREKGEFSLSADGRHVLSADYIIDQDTTYLNVHELSDKYLSVKGSDYSSAYSQAASCANTEEVSDTVTKYDDMLSEFIGSGTSTLEKGVEGDVEGVHYKYNVVTTVLTPENIDEFAEKLAAEIEADETIDSSSEDVSSIIEALKDYDPADGSDVTVVSYIDPNGTIRGIDVCMDGDEKDDPTFSVIMTKQNDHYAMKGSYDDVSVIVDGREKNGKHNGTMTIAEESEDETIKINYSELEIVKNNFITGKISCDLSEITSGDIGQFELVFEEEDGAQKVSTDIDSVGSFIMTVKTGKQGKAEIEVPSESIDVENISEYLEGADLEKFVKDVLVALGVDEDSASQLSGYLSLAGASAAGSLDSGSGYDLYDF